MIPWLTLPSLSALRAFSVFAETGSVTAAGRRLNVSHAAISQQIRALEARLSVPLVDRMPRGLVMTAEGRRLAAALDAGFGEIARVVEELGRETAGRPLKVTTTPSFAAGWLMPRLADFRARHPDIDLVIDASGEPQRIGPQRIGPGDADLAIRYGGGDWPGLDAVLLVPSPIVVVASPSLIGGRRVDSVADVADLPWMQELGTNEASELLESFGIARATAGMTSLPGNLMADAARDGQGVAFTARAFVAADIAAGRLIPLFESGENDGYFLVTRPGLQRPPVRAFIAWARRQARVSGAEAGQKIPPT